MLSSHPSQSMHPPRGIHFRNPFTEPSRSHSHYNHDLDVQSPSSGYGRVSVPVKRLPTPPPDMNTVAPNVQSSQYYYYGDRSAALVKHDPVRIKHEPNAHSQPQPFAHVQPKQEAAAQSSSRPRSPIFTQNPVNNGDRSDSKMNAIAPSLQIPRSVNSSQGSLSELAAQVGASGNTLSVTCSNAYGRSPRFFGLRALLLWTEPKTPLRITFLYSPWFRMPFRQPAFVNGSPQSSQPRRWLRTSSS